MFSNWMWTSWEEAGLIVLSAPLMVIAVITTIRVVGLRSFSKMSSFDFAVTVAIGSIVAGVASTSTSLAAGALAVAALLGTQTIIALLRQRTSFESVVDNTPLLLMRGDEIYDEALAVARVTRADLVAKLREANVLQLSEVRAVVMEATGDVSVLHGECEVDDLLLDGIREIRPDANE